MNLIEEEKTYLMHNYNRSPISLKDGKGCRVYDFDGTEYLDLISGIACVPLGHNHPRIRESIIRHASGLTNVSNSFYTENQILLAKKLTALSGMENCFFSNSGTESNEAAIKLAIVNTKKHEFISAKNAFHGRTIGSLSATYDKKYRGKFKSLVSRFKFINFGDAQKIKEAMTDKTAAVILEPIQGEAGIILPPEGYLKEVSELCESRGVLLILDEVQTGNGRTGTYFEYLSHGMQPHIVTTAKGLANGLPIGATLARGLDFEAGDHASTFGGNSFCTGVANDAIDAIVSGNLMENAIVQGTQICNAISQMNKKSIREVRGKGLMIGLEFKKSAKELLQLFLKRKIIVNVVHEKVLRLLPPLILDNYEADEFINAFNEVVK